MERASLPSSIKILGLDADDTLWQNEEFFRLTQDRFADMLSAYMPPDPLHAELLAAERRNLGRCDWEMEKADAPPEGPRFFKASSFKKVSALLMEM